VKGTSGGRIDEYFGLHGRTALVTGGASGLGVGVARALLEAGARVAITSRSEEKLSQAVGDLGAIGTVLPVPCDITDEASVEAAFDTARERLGPLDVLFNNAGVTWGAPTVDMPTAAWRKVIDTNLTGTFMCVRRFGRDATAAGRGGKVVVVSSINALVAIKVFRTLGYAASKAGLLGLTRQLAMEWAPAGITINALAPGIFPSRMSEWMIENHSHDLLEWIPLGRFGTDEDIGAASIFLASRASDYMTGQVLVIDGGQTVW
jgi:NAD(P)-dependent dehydrogenase (short-subunit alcohol dehydrogenase family)